MLIRDYDEFEKIVKPLDEKELEEIGLKPYQKNEFDISDLDMLQKFCKENKGFHIATITSDGDSHDVEGEFCYTISNCVRRVNREAFLLCKGDSNEEIFLEEIDSFY